MKNKEYFNNKNVLIVGLARSGFSSAGLLLNLGAKVSVTDKDDNGITRQNLQNLGPKAVKSELGKHSKDFLTGIDLVVISPGVPNNALPIVWARESNIPVISEIELAWILCPADVIAITGTCGKTTVVTLAGQVITASGKRVFTCGNIGNPFSCEVENMREGDFVCLEVSSFQLENIDKFKPKISVILNLSRNHLDRYNNMQDYLRAKERIFKNQAASDYLVLNYDDEAVRNLNKKASAKIVYFSAKEGLNQNQSAVLAITGILGIDRDLAMDVFRNFQGVEHRMEEVSNIGGIRFINDSKSTTTEATIWALNNLSCPVILICGGREKGNDYSRVLEIAPRKIKSLISIGEARERINEAFKEAVDTFKAGSLKEATEKAFSLGSAGDCVLFSPMCKSFDMFSNYEERGRVFKAIVSGLSKLKS